ncbi:MAG: hypothetical protein FWC10_01940 [Lentimicrobiaceae bacterium]|nr:hypothetical protein [Lentimicrobiaceae bacterium]
MDGRIEQIEAGLKRHLKNVETSFIASVAEDKKTTVDVKDFNGTLYPDVRKIATENTKGFVPKLPKNSFVIVSRISNSNDLVISMMSEIEDIALDVDGDIVINGGKNDGLVIIQKLTDKLNDLKNSLNDLITNYNSHIHVTTATVGVGPAGVLSPTTSTASPALPFNKSDYENEKIKH